MRGETLFRAVPSCLPNPSHSLAALALDAAMPHLSTEAKHHILLEYSPHDATRSFAALARRHAVKGGHETSHRWWLRWDGTPASLERKQGSGKARVLSRAEVSRHVRAPILAANRAHRAIHYTELLPAVRQKTGTEVSLRSLQRYGKEELGARDKQSKKRTAEESECNSTRERRDASLPVEWRPDSELQCLLACVTRSLTCDASCNALTSDASSSSMRLHSASAPLQHTRLCCPASSHWC